VIHAFLSDLIRAVYLDYLSNLGEFSVYFSKAVVTERRLARYLPKQFIFRVNVALVGFNS